MQQHDRFVLCLAASIEDDSKASTAPKTSALEADTAPTSGLKEGDGVSLVNAITGLSVSVPSQVSESSPQSNCMTHPSRLPS